MLAPSLVAPTRTLKFSLLATRAGMFSENDIPYEDSPTFPVLRGVDDDIYRIEPFVLKYMGQVDESAEAGAQAPANREPSTSPTTPSRRQVSRELSEPGHKSAIPIKPILKGKKTGDILDVLQSRSGQQSHAVPVGNGIPPSFASRKPAPSIDPTETDAVPSSTVGSEEDELFYLPGRGRAYADNSRNKGSTTTRQGNDSNPNCEQENLYREPPTPPKTPPLRATFSQELPYLIYPPTPRNTFRSKRGAPPIVDELDRLQNGLSFPSRRSFTFSSPLESPASSEFPLPPQDAPQAPETLQNASPTQPTRRVSWRRTFSRRSQRNADTERPALVSTASKRKSGPDSEASTKRRKVVKFDLPPDHREHPPIRRRPTPYYEPLSIKIKRVFYEIFASFFESKEEKEREKELKKQRKAEEKAIREKEKAEKRAKKERQELIDSFRHFDDLVD